METEELTLFHNVKEALKSGKPFKLSASADLELNEIPEEKWPLIHNAIVYSHTDLSFIVHQREARFFSGVIRSSTKLTSIWLKFNEDGAHGEIDIEELLAALLSSSSLNQVTLDGYAGTHLRQVLLGLPNMPKLRLLDFRSKIKMEEYEHLAEALRHPLLEHFILNRSELPVELWPILIPVLSSHTHLEKLIIRSPSIALETLGEILSKNTSIREVNLFSRNNVPIEKGMKQFCEGLANNKTVKKIDLPCLTEPAVDVFFDSLAHNRITISTFRVPPSSITSNNIRVLSEALKTNTALTTLTLGSASDRCQILCDGLDQNKTLQKLCLHGISDVHYLCEYLKKNKSLVSLDLSSSQLTDEDFKLLANMLLHNSTLQRLVLEYTNLNDQGLVYICKALESNNGLRHLDLGAPYPFGFAGLTGVKEMLATNATLESLRIPCSWDRAPSLVLRDGLKQNCTLRSIEILSRPYIDPQSVAAALEQNYAIEKVNLDQTRQFPVESELGRLLARNKRLKSEALYKIAILSHNIARNKRDSSATTLPRELWHLVLSQVTHPGLPPFGALVEQIFNLY